MIMQPTHLYTALIDVLAYRQHLKLDQDSGNLNFQNKLSSALSTLDTVNSAIFGIQAISDTIILTCADHRNFLEFLSILQKVFISFLSEGLFIRGGVAYSRHFQNSRLTYSHAVARAYELESQQASYPRIVLDQNIIDMHNVGVGLPCIQSSGLLCLENGIFFLNILTTDNWNEIYSFGKKIYIDNIDSIKLNENNFLKHVRFQRYLLTSPHAPSDAQEYIETIDTL